MSQYGLKDEHIKAIKNILAGYIEIEECIIFGSRALGTFKPGSDVDLALKGKTNHKIAHNVKTDLEKSSMPFIFDVIDYNSIKNKDLVKHIDTKGKLFYKRLDGWKETTLEEFIEVQNGFAFKSEDFTTSGIPIIKIKNIASGKITFDDIQYYSGSPEGFDRYFVRNGEILISMTGSHITQISSAVAKVTRYTSSEIALLNQRVGKIYPLDLSILDNDYLYYFMIQPSTQIFLGGIATGSANQSNISPSQIKILPIFLPSLPEQRAIASILSSLDDKIELLQKENKTLEAIAQNIFKRWFVDFEFPYDFSSSKLDPKGKPYKSSGGKMINSELGKIPEGWKIGKFGDFVNICGGTTPDTSNQEFWNGDINWTSPKDLSDHRELFILTTEKRITLEGLYQISSRLLPENTLLLSSRAPIGYIAITTIPLAINQGYIAFLPHAKLQNEYMLFWLKVNMEKVISSANGSTFLEISKSSFRNIETFLPDFIILDKFLDVIQPILNKIKNNISKARSLSNARDKILPRLMNGEIRIKY